MTGARPSVMGLVLAVLLLGCQASGGGTAAPAASAPATETAPTEAESTAAASEAGATAEDAFPVSIEHTYGSTEIPERPERVVTVGFNDQDFVLALGVVPVAEREFLGADASGRPWAQEALDGARPEQIDAVEIDFELIAALEPDLILGLYSAMTAEEYGTLSQIAPTVAQPGEYIDFGVPWPEQMERTGDALGEPERAAEIVADVEAQVEEARAAHPEFEGASLVFAAAAETEPYVYGSGDLRAQFFTSLGFVTPDRIDELAGDAFFAQIGEEQLTLFDEDVLVVYGDEAQLTSNPVFAGLDVATEGRTLYLDQTSDLAIALGFSSPLSIPFALDAFTPRLAAAVDGDPSTPVEPS